MLQPMLNSTTQKTPLYPAAIFLPAPDMLRLLVTLNVVRLCSFVRQRLYWSLHGPHYGLGSAFYLTLHGILPMPPTVLLRLVLINVIGSGLMLGFIICLAVSLAVLSVVHRITEIHLRLRDASPWVDFSHALNLRAMQTTFL